MRKFREFFKLAFALAIIPMLILSSCKDETTTVSAYETLKTYMEENSLDLPDLLVDWVKPADVLVDTTDYSIPSYYVIDIREAADFGAGHIKDAVNSTLADILTEAGNAAGKPILVVCYTGQTAAHAVMALRLSGYSDAVVLKFGMCGWHDDFAGSWLSNSGHDNGNTAIGSANWNSETAPALGSFDAPEWTSSSTDGAEILAERVATTISGGFLGVASADVLANPDNYQIINYWAEADYLTFGHFNGAFQLSPINFTNVDAFDFNSTSLVYCYTGQTSSMATFWLNTLGYNVKSIKFGANSLVYDLLSAAGKPNYHGTLGYAYVTD